MDTPKGTDLRYEETPIIDPEAVIPEAAKMFQPEPSVETPAPPIAPSQPKSQPKRPSFVGKALVILILFGLGVWLSLQLRSFFASAPSESIIVPTLAPYAYPTVEISSSSGGLVTTEPTWISHEAMPGVYYKLPETIVAPVCDGSSCVSKGTNLPGGTRFTVAPRGKGFRLPDFRGAILTDAAGKEFTMNQTTVGGISVYEYIGNFAGRTGGGYSFTTMRGVLVPVSDTVAVDFNHFSPVGIETDFAKDDALFDQIIGTFTSASSSAMTK